jgi:hypothetical protein
MPWFGGFDVALVGVRLGLGTWLDVLRVGVLGDMPWLGGKRWSGGFGLLICVGLCLLL